ncbi:hypothetical protein Tco_0589026 [Tanacetum coccineum]
MGQLADSTGTHNLSDAEIYAGLATLWGYAGDIVPLLPAILAGAAMDQGEVSTQPAEPHPTPVDSLPSTSLSHQSPPHSPHQSPPHSPFQSPPYSPPRVTSLEKELKDTKQTLGNVVLKLVKKVKSLKKALKRKSKKVIVSASEVASQSDSKAKSTDKGKRYRRRARSMAKKINTGLDAEDEINTGRVEINIGIEDVNTGSAKDEASRWNNE